MTPNRLHNLLVMLAQNPVRRNILGSSLVRSNHLISPPTFNNCFVKSLSSYTVKSFGQLVFEGRGNVNIEPINPQEYPDMNVCTVHCDGSSARWKVCLENDTLSVKSDSPEAEADTWHVKVPIKYEVDVRCGGRASVAGLESARVAVTAAGGATVAGLRCGHVTLRTDTDVRVQRALLGNVSIEAEEVDASGARLQGQTVNISARRRCRLADIYADNVSIDVATADLQMGTVHGTASIRSAGTGQLVIGGVDGALDVWAPRAGVRCHIHQLSADSAVRCGGALCLTVAPTARCRLRVQGPPPRLDPQLGPAEEAPDGGHCVRLGGAEEPQLRVESEAGTEVGVKSWAATVAGWT